jgi:hypothetical protein
VVEVGPAVACIDTALVKLEREMVSLNGNRDGVKSNSSSQSIFTFSGNFGAVTDCPGLIFNFVFAGGTNSSVGIFLFSCNSVIFNVPEGLIHESSVAALIAV